MVFFLLSVDSQLTYSFSVDTYPPPVPMLFGISVFVTKTTQIVTHKINHEIVL